MSALAPLIEKFFVKRLMQQRQCSSHTIAAYRDTWRLLLKFAEKKLDKNVGKLTLTDLDADMISAFLDHLENERGNSVRTRNSRLAAINAFFRFVSLEVPEHSGLIYRVLAIPQKRHEKRIVTFLDHEESEALLATPDLTSRLGRRDHAMMLMMIETGLRVSEIIGLNLCSIVFGTGAHVRCLGKGRKERATPLSDELCNVLDNWITERRGEANDPLFVSRQNGRLSPDAIERLA